MPADAQHRQHYLRMCGACAFAFCWFANLAGARFPLHDPPHRRTELLQLQQLFDRLDRDGSGALDIDDLEKEVEHNDAVHAHP